MTQAQLAEKAGVSRTAVGYILRGARTSLELTDRMAELLGVELCLSIRPARPAAKRKRARKPRAASARRRSSA